MKAFISARSHRWDRIRKGYSDTRLALSFQAIAEAKRILEETEGDNPIYGTKDDYDVNGCLAESLENFLKG